ncbi:UbiA prenyltransferase family protein [Changchengzhania lutea]|uniref:hypothetical protein n=1 Tax=Changchengzhania lutea TaxID=2049305 RepID=UPI00115EDC97|nr:hypothetical protein [Changchengzhania lutea]
MPLVKQLLNFYINSSIHVALSVYALSWLTLLNYNIDYDEHVLYFIFFASITGYNFVKYFGMAKFHHRSLTPYLKGIQIFSLGCFLAMCYYAFKLEMITLICVAGLAIITFLYAIPFLPKSIFLDDKQNLRSISGLKVYLIALVWALVTVLLPLINNGYHLNTDIIIDCFQRYIFVIILMLPFEIRDLKFDSLKLSTIPQEIGVKGTKLMGLILIMMFFGIIFLKDSLSAQDVLLTLTVSIIIGLFVMFSKVNQGHYYSALWVEAIPIFWLLLKLI